MMEESIGEKETQPTKGFDLIEKLILDGEAPPHIRMAAAKGALPLPPLSLLRLKVFLLGDADSSVKAEASRQLKAYSEDELFRMLAEKRCHPSVLLHFAIDRRDDKRFLEVILQNPSADDGTLARIAETASADVVELLITNEQRLIASPSLVDAIEKNPRLNDLLKTKLTELKEKFLKGEARAEPVVETTEESVEELSEIDVDAVIGDSYILDGYEFESEPQDVRNVYKNIMTMSVPEKIMRALKGSLAERRILVRDSNKIVSLTVLQNPKLSEQEVEIIAAAKNVDEEILREVGRSREWTKHYGVLLNLVKNPKTPPGISTSLIHRLTNTDLKQMQNDKNVPELIRGMAKKVLSSRTQQASPLKKK
ncbi:MAG: hypothetical protein AB1756_05180 [Acidobacteriota bacterium]